VRRATRVAHAEPEQAWCHGHLLTAHRVARTLCFHRGVTRLRAAFSFALVLAATCVNRRALACGAAYPGGPMVCSVERDAPSARAAAERRPPVARVSTSYALTQTTLSFGGDRARMLRHAVFAGTELPLGPKTAVQFGAGGIAAGTLERRGTEYDLGPGVGLFAGLGGRVIPEKRFWPFVQLTGTLSVTRAQTRSAFESVPYTAFDLRLAAIVGKTIGGRVTPYGVLRAFGGPIVWRAFGDARSGTDLYKYQVGAGALVAIWPRRIDLFAEGIAAGERGIAAGLGVTFD
jgi:hypothetical protein